MAAVAQSTSVDCHAAEALGVQLFQWRLHFGSVAAASRMKSRTGETRGAISEVSSPQAEMISRPLRSRVWRSSDLCRNWEQIFAFVPDIRAQVLRLAVDGDSAWTEWEMTGTRRDGTAHHMRGVIVLDVLDGMARSARFYLEPVDAGARTVDDAVRDQVVRG